MGIDELTSGGGGVSNPLSEDLDAGGNAINNAGAVGTDALTVDGLPGVPLGDEESGSPYTASGANSINPSGLDSYDVYVIKATATDTASSTNNVALQIDGDTGTNYNEQPQNGSRSTGNSEWGPITLFDSGVTMGMVLVLAEYRGGVKMSSFARAADNAVIMAGDNSNVSWPPSQFTLKRGAGTDWTVRIWGRNV